MRCEHSQLQLQAYFDGELDAASASVFERHLKTCSECQSALAVEEALRASITQVDLYERAPAELHRAIAKQLPASPTPSALARSVSPAWRWLALAASCLFLATLGWLTSQRFQGPAQQPPFIAAALDAHLRSLQPGHLADVESTDQHTVKPWFDGKLDFAPPVRDFSADGFPLLGGRLDVFDGKTVAALVYGRRKHIVNVFVCKAAKLSAPAGSGQLQGYQWLAWQKNGFSFCAVSDASTDDLQQLAQLFQRD